MPDTLECLVDRRERYTVVRLIGALDVSSVARVRSIVRKTLVEQPPAILVDLSGVGVCDPPYLAVFRVLARQAARWPVIPMLLCAPSPAVAAVVGPVSGLVYPSVDAASAQIGWGPATPVVAEDLLPVVGAGRRGREVVVEACLRWELPHLVGPACVVVSELVNNAVEHAGTMITLRLTLRPRHLHLVVQDGSTAPPVLGGPGPRSVSRGLRLVNAEAATWGHLATADSKAVWATFSRVPRR
jgi:anti-anti-sigma regulatory factor